MKLGRLLEACLYADDLNQAESFYRKILGLSVFAKVDNRHVFFKLENQMFLVFQPEATMTGEELPAHGAVGPGHIAFAIRDGEYEDWKKLLTRHRVIIDKEMTWPGGGRSIYFRDPAGNSVELATPKIWGLPE